MHTQWDSLITDSHSHTHTHTHARTHRHMHTNVCTRTHRHMHTCTHTDTHTHTHADTRAHTQTHAHMHAHTHTASGQDRWRKVCLPLNHILMMGHACASKYSTFHWIYCNCEKNNILCPGNMCAIICKFSYVWARDNNNSKRVEYMNKKTAVVAWLPLLACMQFFSFL